MKTIDKVKEVHYFLRDEHNLNVELTMLYGSQNYQLDNDRSDVDVHAYVLPSLRDLIDGKRIAKVYKTPYGEATVRDLRDLVPLLRKANPTTLEIIVSDYIYPNVQRLVDKDTADIIALGSPINFLKATVGTLIGKKKQLDKGLDNFTLYPKELMHYVRLVTMVEDIFIKGVSFEDAVKNSSSLELLQRIRSLDTDLEMHEEQEIRTWIAKDMDSMLNIESKVKEGIIKPKYDRQLYESTIDALEERIITFITNSIMYDARLNRL